MAYRVDIVLDQGSDYVCPFEFYDNARRPVNFNGFEAHMQVRRTASSTVIVDELSTEGEVPRLSFESNVLKAKWPRAITSAIKAGRYVYDLEVTEPGGGVKRLMEGAFVIKQEVTR